MQHDAWPPIPPGGHRPPDAPPFTSPGDQLLAVGLGAAAGAGALVWASGQAAGLVFGHTWLELSPADVAHVLWHLPQHWSDPAVAWPADVRGPLPGPAGMYATFAGLVGGLSGGTAAVLRHLPGRAAGHRPGHGRPAKHAGAVWAGGRELRLLTVREPEPGRVILGRTPGAFGRLLAAEDCHSVLVFGPTGSYKTSALVIPEVLEWSGPLVATSVKPDLLRATMAHRARLGQVLVIDPLGAPLVAAGVVFDVGGRPADRRPAGQCHRADPHRGATARASVLEDHGHQVPRPDALRRRHQRPWHGRGAALARFP
jgi:type IV secretion system protein VirD4